VKLDDSIRPQKVTIYRGGTPRGGRRLGRNPRHGAPVALGGKKPSLWAGPTSRRRRPSGL
jgi:hypothetical protein